MALIARHSGVSKALLYHYYPGKDALIFDIIHSHLAGLEQAVVAADTPDAAPEARLHALVAAVLETYRDADDAHRVQLNASAALSDAQRHEVTQIERRIVRRFAEVLSAVNPGLAAPGGALMPVTMSLFGILNWAYMWFRDGGALSREDYARLATTLVLNGVKGLP